MRPMLAFAIPALFTGLSFYWLKLSRPLLPAALPGQGRGRSVHGRELAQPAAVPRADGLPHGVAAVALRQAARARAAQEDGGADVHLLPRPQRAPAGRDGGLHAVHRPHLLERALLEHRADDLRAGPVGGRLRSVLRLLGRLQRRQEEPHDPGVLRHRLGGQHRPQLSARAGVRHVGGGLDTRDRLRHPGGDRLLLLRELVPDPLRVAAAAPHGARRGAHAGRGLGRRTRSRSERVHAVPRAGGEHAGAGADPARLPARAVRDGLLHARRAPEARGASGAPAAAAGTAPPQPAVAAAGARHR